MKYLIAGLGNIGPEYALTRHNVGFMVLDKLAEIYGLRFTTERLAYLSQWQFKQHTIYLLKPTTYMNLSGRAIGYYKNWLKIEAANLLVVVDELQLPYGSLKLKARGSAGGHNGLRSTQEALGSENFARLRVGIGSNFPKGGQVDYVLSPFSSQELINLPDTLDLAANIVVTFCTLGIEKAMNQFNK